ncbi:hypothetical protein F4779DRAFT_621500 [Xylariaceae sp. FL0662B]|nr:hypothetical protein F4779DRAFT_621500 [Xylariaceae sp. FL0662B]
MAQTSHLRILRFLDISFHRAHRVEDHRDSTIQCITTTVPRSPEIPLIHVRGDEYKLPFKVGDGLAIHTVSKGTYPTKLEIKVGGLNAACLEGQQQNYFVTPEQGGSTDGTSITRGFSLSNIAPNLSVEEGMEKTITIDIVTANGFSVVAHCQGIAPPESPEYEISDEQCRYNINDVQTSDRVWELKCRIRDRCGISPHEFDIGCDYYKRYEDDEVLSNIGVSSESHVECYFKHAVYGGGAAFYNTGRPRSYSAITAAGKIHQRLFLDKDTSRWDTARYKRITVNLVDINSVPELTLPDILGPPNGYTRAPVDRRSDWGPLPSVLSTTSFDADLFGFLDDFEMIGTCPECNDSGLSVTGNIVGILTFAYAVFISCLAFLSLADNASQEAYEATEKNKDIGDHINTQQNAPHLLVE